MTPKHSASIAIVVVACSSAANRTNLTRNQASTAQKTLTPPNVPESLTRYSPGAQTAGRRPRWPSRRHSTFAPATRRRKLRADPVNPSPRAAGSNRFAEIRPADRGRSSIRPDLLIDADDVHGSGG